MDTDSIMKKVNFASYEAPKAEEIKLEISGIMSNSPDGEGGGNEDYGQGGEA